MLLALSLAKSRKINPKLRTRVITGLRSLPDTIEETLKLKDAILEIAPEIANKDNALFLGRGIFYPIAKEGAFKLKEISSIKIFKLKTYFLSIFISNFFFESFYFFFDI